MNETLNTILTRRSTRKFSDKPIPEDEMELIVQAALHAFMRPAEWDSRHGSLRL